jgi:pimeloyl-ACP methyl ester carboxylesterase
MRLEVIPFGTPSERPPLLFVHGAFSGAWVWAEHFLPFFAQQGWSGAALSLRGHGISEGRQWLHLLGLQDYLCDITEVAATLGRPPVLVGHSMGALLVQMYARDHAAAGLVVLAGLPPWGLASSAQAMTLRHPVLVWQLTLLQTLGPWAVDGDFVASSLFSKHTPRERVVQLMARFQRESERATFEAMFPRLPPYAPRPTPALVIGGDKDPYIPLRDVRGTAEAWSGDLAVIADMPHAMMLDATWREPAEIMEKWLRKQFG